METRFVKAGDYLGNVAHIVCVEAKGRSVTVQLSSDLPPVKRPDAGNKMPSGKSFIELKDEQADRFLAAIGHGPAAARVATNKA